MYTELIFGAELKLETPDFIINTLKYLLDMPYEGNIDYGITNSRNPLRGGSYYFGVNLPISEMWQDEYGKEYHISTRANIKNYENEIENFLKWIKPYIKSGSGNREMYAIVIYEQANEPTIYYLENPETE